jgi:MFS family permease
MSGRDRAIVTTIGTGQILAWGSSFYLIAVLAGPVEKDTGWPLAWLVAGQSLALVVAAMASPYVGRWIGHGGGRVVLAVSSLLLAGAHVVLATTTHLSVWYAGWFIMGLAMACGLYDAAFGTLGQIFGAAARRAITNVTLFGGLASTICWPLSAAMIEMMSWRGACLAYACLHLFIMMPLHLFVLPRSGERLSASAPKPDTVDAVPSPGRSVYLLLVVILTTAAAIAGIVSVHLIALLQERGLTLVLAVAMGAVFGPAQVAGRIVELVFGRHYHPVWTLMASLVLVCLGIALLGFEGPIALVAASLVLYGAGNGINSIARGTVPLALFGPQGYAQLMGRLALPALLAQAIAPPLAAWFIDARGGYAALHLLAALALINVLAGFVLLSRTRAQRMS